MVIFRAFVSLVFRLLGVGCILFAFYYGINHPPHDVVLGIIHVPSLVFVGLGLVGITLASYQSELILGMSGNLVWRSPYRVRERFLKAQGALPDLAEVYYEKGAAALLEEVDRRKLKGVLPFIASKLEAKIPIPDTQVMVQTEGKHYNEKFFTQIRALQGLATVAPAVGMTGTILGLIQLLKGLQDFESLGSNMALAFITALYGLVFGNFILIPLVNRLNSVREESLNLFSQGLSFLDIIAHRKPADYLDNATKQIAV